MTLTVLVGALSATPAQADTAAQPSYPAPPDTKLWKSHWPTFSAWEGVGTVAAGAGTAVLFMVKTPDDPRWDGGALFDDGVRDGMRLKSAGSRKTARSIGDMTYFAAPLLPILVDPFIAAWIGHGDSKAALNLSLISLEAFSYAGFLSFVSTRASARERPDTTECKRQNGADSSKCPGDTESFISGHTAISATSAGIVCANHQHMPLWGHPVADVGACVLATASALTTGVTRIAADRHYTTDVLAGFGVGFGVGYAVPTLLHYTRSNGNPAEKTDIKLSVQPGGPCTGACLKLAGTF